MALSLTSYTNALKVLYTPQRFIDMAAKNRPLLGMIEKMTRFGGKSLPIPVRAARPGGRATTVAVAQSSHQNGSQKEFSITRVKNYGVFQIEGEVLKASEGDAFAFMSAQQVGIDGVTDMFLDDVANDLYRSGSGLRGKVGALPGGGVITLETAEDDVNFEIGMSLRVAPTSEITALRGGTQTGVVTAVARNATSSSVTYSGTITNIAVGDFIFCEGDAHNNDSYKKIRGLAAWLPATAPTSGDSFWGVDRSVDPSRLAGLRYDGTSETIEEALISAMAFGRRNSIKPSRPLVAFMNPVHYADLCKSIQGRSTYERLSASKASADVGYEAVTFPTPNGRLTCVEDPFCPTGVIYLLDLGSWKLYSLGPVPHILEEDGLMLLRDSDEDAYELRIGAYYQLGCDNPGGNIRVAVAT